MTVEKDEGPRLHRCEAVLRYLLWSWAWYAQAGVEVGY